MSSDDRLRLIVERIERISEEIAGLQADRRDIYAEAKATGFDVATIRRLIARRAMPPADRAEADALLDVYEAAMGDAGPPVVVRRPDERAADMAHALLAEQVAGLDDPERAALLVDHVTALLDLRAEIAVLREAEAARRKLAAGEGFLAKQLAQVVRWIEKCAKHGEEAMRAGEAAYLIYRGTMDAARGRSGPVTADPVLAEAFAPPPPKKPSAKTRRLAEVLFWAGDAQGKREL